VIVELAPPLVDALVDGGPGRPSGRLIVSGVIDEREAEVRAALEAAGACVDSSRAIRDWRCIEAVRV
jgi:ribosomal protein L11 methylase PrmA